MTRLALILSLLPGAAMADPQPEVADLMHYMDGTAACFDRAGDPAEAAACEGRGATLCMETEEGGYSTMGMTFCTLAEYEAWDALLNREYVSTMNHLEALDAQEAGSFPEFANRADSLRAAQLAWITVRDADCGLEYAMWGAGSMRQIAGSGCRLSKVAERTIYLRFLAERMQ